MNCSNCGEEIRESDKFCSNCGKENDVLQKAKDGTISLRDLILMRDKIAGDVDLEKPLEELSDEDKVHRVFYEAIDKTIAEHMDEGEKEKLDNAQKELRKLDHIQEGLHKIVALGQEIEKNLLVQYTYLSIHFEKTDENKFYTTVDKLSSALVSDNGLPNDGRIELANDILNIVDAYDKKIWSGLSKCENLIESLLQSFEKNLLEYDFDYLESLQNESFNSTRNDLFEWLKLTKELIPARQKGVKALKADLEKERIIPRIIIENKGDISIQMSPMEMNLIGQKMVDLINESDQVEKSVAEKRKDLSVSLFGKSDDYMLDDTEQKTEDSPIPVEEPQNVENKSLLLKWTIVVILSAIALMSGIWTAVGVFVLGTIIIYILSAKKS